MRNSIHSVQAANQRIQTEQTVQPPKTAQQEIQTTTPEDKVTISGAAKQALANNT
jgi:hypothetical protein